MKRGEKPSKFFINLETKNLQAKLFLRLNNDIGEIITDQNQILEEAKSYYEKLYSKRDTSVKYNLQNEIPFSNIPKLSDNIKESLEGEYNM